MTRQPIRIGVIGLGWMGQAHSRSYARIPRLWPERLYDPVLAVCADNVEDRRAMAVDDFGFEQAVVDWREIIDRDDIDVITCTAPNMLHEEICTAAAEAGKHIFCEKPVGGKPDQTVRVEKVAREAGVVTGVGYNYRFAPLVQYLKGLIDSGELGEITNYRGRFFSMYGSDPLGLLSWRFEVDQAGHGVSTDILSHSMDLAHMLVGPITRVMGTQKTFITERPLPKPGGTHYDRGEPGDPTGPVTNEDYFGAFVEFMNGAVGTFEASRSIIGPESENAFDVYGTKGAANWNLETMNELGLCLLDDKARGYTTVRAGDRHPYHGAFVPGDANSIGFEDLVTIEDYEYLNAVASGSKHTASFSEAVDFVSVQAALIKSTETGQWEEVVDLRED